MLKPSQSHAWSSKGSDPVLYERHPRHDGGEFLILRPRRSHRLAEFSCALGEFLDGHSKLRRALLEKLFLLHSHNRKLAMLAGLQQGFAKKLALRGVDQSMRF